MKQNKTITPNPMLALLQKSQNQKNPTNTGSDGKISTEGQTTKKPQPMGAGRPAVVQKSQRGR
jgi:hypothetical protein